MNWQKAIKFEIQEYMNAEEILKNCKRYFIESGYRTSDTVILLEDAIDAIYNFLDKNK